jgi:hypothetical protein
MGCLGIYSECGEAGAYIIKSKEGMIMYTIELIAIILA